MKIEFKITEEELQTMFKDKILKYLKLYLNDGNLEYWIRKEVNKLISEKIIDDVIERDFSNEKIKEIMKRAFDDYVREKFDE